jgi:hypothetical protein
VYADEGPERGNARATISLRLRYYSSRRVRCYVPPVMKDVWAALRTILEEAFILEGEVLLTGQIDTSSES